MAEIRSRLSALGLLPGEANPTDPVATFDQACDRAVRGFQQQRGLRADGIVGAETYRALEEARWRLGDRILRFAAAHPYVGDDVGDLQQRLHQLGFDPGRVDGIFGPRTESALREFQRATGLAADGTCGPRTFAALRSLARTVTGGSPTHLREHEQLLAGGPALAGKVVVLDPGHGGEDRGAVGHGLEEAGVVADLATRAEGRLGAVGVVAFLTHGPDSCPADAERAAFANNAGADVLISLHTDWQPSPRASGAATYFYGSHRGRFSSSAAGERLAALVQEEITERTDLVDCRAHRKSWELLRLTRMPAVRVDAGYLSSPGDCGRLASAEFRDTLAEGIVAAVARLFTPEDVPARR